MKKHGKKMIAPIIIISCVVLYYIFIVIVFLFVDGISVLIKIPGLVIPIALIGIGIFVLRERIKEIRSGEEDDLGKY